MDLDLGRKIPLSELRAWGGNIEVRSTLKRDSRIGNLQLGTGHKGRVRGGEAVWNESEQHVISFFHLGESVSEQEAREGGQASSGNGVMLIGREGYTQAVEAAVRRRRISPEYASWYAYACSRVHSARRWPD